MNCSGGLLCTHMTISHPHTFSPEDYRPAISEQDLTEIAGKFGARHSVPEVLAYRDLVDENPHDVSSIEMYRQDHMSDESRFVADVAEQLELMTPFLNVRRHAEEAKNLGYLALSDTEMERYRSMLGKPKEVAHFIGWFRTVAGAFFMRPEGTPTPKIGIDMGGNQQMGIWQHGRDTHRLAKAIPKRVEKLFGEACSTQLIDDPELRFQYMVVDFHAEPFIERHPLTTQAGLVRRRLPLADMHFMPGDVEYYGKNDGGSGGVATEITIPEQTVRLYMQSQALLLPGLVPDRRHREYLAKVQPIADGIPRENQDAHAAEVAGYYFQDGIIRLRGKANNILPLDSRIIAMALRPDEDVVE